MNTFVILMRGINVGGKNRVPMTELKQCLEKLGFLKVRTYLASGNILLQSTKDAAEIKTRVEEALPINFKLDSKLIKVLILSLDQLQTIVDSKPEDFGEHRGTYHSDVIFLMGIDEPLAMSVFNPKQGVDTIRSGKGVIYSQRLSALRTKSHLSRIVGTTAYQSMTIRTWGTTIRLLELLKNANQ